VLPEVTLLTPCYKADVERLAFLRESLMACGVDLPHVVVVPDDDRHLFERFESQPGLSVRTYAEVLPAQLVKRLDRGPTIPDRVRHRLTGRHLLKMYWGWMAQQYVKLCAGSVVDTTMWVCVDSDIFFVQKMTVENFLSPSGRPLLLQLVDYPLGDDEVPPAIAFRNSAARLLGIRPEQLETRHIYSGWIVPFHRAVVDELLDYLGRRSKRAWWEVMAQFGATEYETYGLFARHIHGLRDVEPEDHRWCWLFYDVDNFAELLRYAITETEASAAMVDAHLDCDLSAIHDSVRSQWIEQP
jgi:hypothetical protein